ncbi:MAG TPA: hypothetical protein VGC66_09370 [Pyrinomonadaceae bacterium]|jgi:hypothetical protein
MKNVLIKNYIELLKEASEIRMVKLPEILLPAPKDKLRREIELEIKKDPEQESSYYLLGALDLFSHKAHESLLASKLAIVPFLISFFYVIWIVFHGAPWLWLLNPVVIEVGAMFSLMLKMLGKERNFGQILLVEAIAVITFSCYSAIFIRLVFYSGFYGLYTSTIKEFSLWNLGLSLLAIFFGWHYSKAINKLHYFLFTNKYMGVKELGFKL